MNAYPHSTKEELSLIGCCLFGGLNAALEVVESVPIDAITTPSVRDVFRIIESMATKGQDINPYTVALRWKQENKCPVPVDVVGMADNSVMVCNLKLHADAVLELWRKRRLLEALSAVTQKAQRDEVKASQIIAKLERSICGEEINSIQTVGTHDGLSRMVNDLERRFQLQGKLSGVETGFSRLDYKLDGIQFGEQTIIGARPSMGKTAIGIGIIMHACIENKVPSLFISLEMSIEALYRRMCSARSGIPMQQIRRGSYTEEQFRKFVAFQGFAEKCPLWITDAVKGIGINELCAVVRRRVRKHGIKLVVIDYLQKIRASERQEKKTYEIGEVSTQLRALAVSSGVAMVTLAQLNRESDKDKGRPPRLSDLGDSKQIEQDADTVLLINRKRDDQTGDTHIIIAKQRDGAVGTEHLTFNGSLCRFENPAVASTTTETKPPYND